MLVVILPNIIPEVPISALYQKGTLVERGMMDCENCPLI